VLSKQLLSTEQIILAPEHRGRPPKIQKTDNKFTKEPEKLNNRIPNTRAPPNPNVPDALNSYLTTGTPQLQNDDAIAELIYQKQIKNENNQYSRWLLQM